MPAWCGRATPYITPLLTWDRTVVGWGHAPPKACRKRHNHMQPSQFHDYLSKVAWMERSGIRDG
ncbi:MAG: hypothetical protein ABW124_13300 [Candidatus Thiodiazotropha sp. 6PLUC9]